MALVSGDLFQPAVPRDAQELHDRAHAYMSSVSSTLDSIEGLLASWDCLRDGLSAGSDAQRTAAFRSVHLNPFTVRRPPPMVSEAEVDRAVKRLTAKELRALHDEYELTYVDNCVYLHSDRDSVSSVITSAQGGPADSAGGDTTERVSIDSFQPVATLSAAANNTFESPSGCTVELEYSMDDWKVDSERMALLGLTKESAVLKATAVTHVNTTPSTDVNLRTSSAAGNGAAVSTSASDDEDEIHSFITFSRMALANESLRMRARPAEDASSVFPKKKWQGQTKPKGESASVTAHCNADPSPGQNPSASAVASALSTAVSSPHSQGAANPDQCSKRNNFVRTRVRDVLLANQVRAMDTSLLRDAFVAKMDQALNAAAAKTTPVLERLQGLLCESRVLLRALDVMDHQAYRDRVKDPTQYLCIPRYRAACEASDCHKSFSATVTRVTCGRCGQFFCPICCTERGVGPDVKCGGQRYSLGWEPLCRLCYQVCLDSQRRVSEDRRHVPLITSRPSDSGDAQEGVGEKCTSNPNTAQEVNLKQAVLFGAYCEEPHCLSDGLPPFYIVDCKGDDSLNLWDILSYRFAKARGSLMRSWQNAGSLAIEAVNGAAHVMSRRTSALRK